MPKSSGALIGKSVYPKHYCSVIDISSMGLLPRPLAGMAAGCAR